MGNSGSKARVESTLQLLFSDDVSLTDDSYWEQLFRTPLTQELLDAYLPFERVREARRARSRGLVVFFSKALTALRRIIQLGLKSEINSAASDVALTCVALLTRVIPVLLEASSDQGAHQHGPFSQSPRKDSEDAQLDASVEECQFVYSLFWGATGVHSEHPIEPQLSNASSKAASTLTNGVTAGTSSGVVKPWEELNVGDEPLAVRILSTLQELLFLKNFTVLAPGVIFPENYVPPKHKVNTRLLWKGGIGGVKEVPSFANASIYTNRRVVLRCLLVCLSSPLYLTRETYRSAPPSLWLWAYTRGSLPYTANLYCSLMSTLFSYNPSTGFGLGYGGLFGTNKEPLADVALQLLCVLFDFNFAPHLKDEEEHDANAICQRETGDQDAAASTVIPAMKRPPAVVGEQASDPNPVRAQEALPPKPTFRNVFRVMLATMKYDYEMDTIFYSIVRLLRSSGGARNTPLRLSRPTPSDDCHQELLLMLWHFITISPVFLSRITSHLNSNDLLVSILGLMLSTSTRLRESSDASARSPQKTDSNEQHSQTGHSMEYGDAGVVHLCSFILLVLSSERQFAVRLNEPFEESFSLPLCAFRGCYADLLILVIHQVILNSLAPSVNEALIDMLITTICNISAYIKAVCLESCVKLMSLVKRFSRPSWLFREPYKYRDLFLLLEALNNMIQYQYEGNTQLVYSILRQHEVFENLNAMTFPAKGASLSASHLERDEAVPQHSTHVGSPSVPEDSAASQENTETENPGAPTASDTAAVPTADPADKPAVDTVEDKTKWHPTEEWFNDWKSKSPLHTIFCLIDTLLPQVNEACQTLDLSSQQEVLAFLSKTTMVGIFPVPDPILVRNYFPHAATTYWFTILTWRVVASKMDNLFDPKYIKLVTLPTFQ